MYDAVLSMVPFLSCCILSLFFDCNIKQKKTQEKRKAQFTEKTKYVMIKKVSIVGIFLSGSAEPERKEDSDRGERYGK